MFEPWQLAAMDDAGYNGIREEHIDRAARSMTGAGLTEFDVGAFEYHCRRCGIDPDSFSEEDIDLLREMLNE